MFIYIKPRIFLRIKRFVTNSLLFSLSCIICVLLAELVLRICVDEVNYLRPELINHPHLRHVIKPYSSGHDKWGFRNVVFPDQAEVVAIGDSFTYGVSASANESWPAWLARMSDKDVYNMGLGGYSLDDYLWLLQNKAHELDPKQVYISVYLGNDLIVRSKSSLRMQRERTGISWSEYASRHSVLYQMIKLRFATLLAPIKRRNAISQSFVPIELNTQHIHTLITLEKLNYAQNLTFNGNQQRLRVALGLLAQISDECQRALFDCTILFIPSKSAVYQEFSEAALSPKDVVLIKAQVKRERFLFSQFSGVFASRQDAYIDLLPALRLASKKQALYPSDDDNHLLGIGYKVIADEVIKYGQTFD